MKINPNNKPSRSGSPAESEGYVMKLKETNWTSVMLNDRTILKRDLLLMSKEQREALGNLEVIKIYGKRQKNSERYKVI